MQNPGNKGKDNMRGKYNIGGPKIKIKTPQPDTNGVASYAYQAQASPIQTKPMEISNEGDQGANWSSQISYDPGAQGWLSLNPDHGYIADNQTSNIDVTVNTAGLQPGNQYTATANLRWDPIPEGTLVVKLFT